MEADTVLEVRNFSVSFGILPAVRDVSFSLKPGETLALVGESGSGKSVTSLGILKLTPPAPFCRIEGQALLRTRKGDVVDLVTASADAMRGLRGREAAMIFQEPMTSLNPVHPVGAQVGEALRFHQGLSKRAALAQAAELLDLVGIPDARRRLGAFPHELSGGMRQRVMIALALACEPVLLIADEPTTALDVTIQAQILELLQRLQQRTKMGVLFITHNLGVVAEIADRVMVMYAGRVVEQAPVRRLFHAPLMPYTRGLLRSVPRPDFSGAEQPPLEAIPGSVPDPLAPPPGCSFSPRCGHFAPGLCDSVSPPLSVAEPDHLVRCARWADVAGAA
ncbi:ABC transporter ATP-binding protein [Roseomonas sp. 18066]|uniref:ABC transporter ATP-binding protein n=1 Tax=Roseomonas sp. 18066 TaxID=2681412 RepID=UPI00135C45E2|nr:ABC transporter ATP-binding protein [Roseomonas sp. 18066]